MCENRPRLALGPIKTRRRVISPTLSSPFCRLASGYLTNLAMTSFFPFLPFIPVFLDPIVRWAPTDPRMICRLPLPAPTPSSMLRRSPSQHHQRRLGARRSLQCLRWRRRLEVVLVAVHLVHLHSITMFMDPCRNEVICYIHNHSGIARCVEPICKFTLRILLVQGGYGTADDKRNIRFRVVL